MDDLGRHLTYSTLLSVTLEDDPKEDDAERNVWTWFDGEVDLFSPEVDNNEAEVVESLGVPWVVVSVSGSRKACSVLCDPLSSPAAKLPLPSVDFLFILKLINEPSCCRYGLSMPAGS